MRKRPTSRALHGCEPSVDPEGVKHVAQAQSISASYVGRINNNADRPKS